jgi:uncharacterized alkaline shock family protein YloU
MSEVKGNVTLTADVVNQIAGHSARGVEGLHRLGKANFFNKLKGGDALGDGILAEVGNEEVAFDIDVVIEYGFPLEEVSQRLRDNISNQVKTMLGRTVVECNINVVGVHFPEPPAEAKPEPTKRVK